MKNAVIWIVAKISLACALMLGVVWALTRAVPGQGFGAAGAGGGSADLRHHESPVKLPAKTPGESHEGNGEVVSGAVVRDSLAGLSLPWIMAAKMQEMGRVEAGVSGPGPVVAPGEADVNERAWAGIAGAGWSPVEANGSKLLMMLSLFLLQVFGGRRKRRMVLHPAE